MRKTLLMLAILVAFCASADTWTDPDTGYTWNYDNLINGTVRIRGTIMEPAISPNPTGVINIPSAIVNKEVSEIGYRAFINCSNLVSVVIPENVTKIGQRAFSDCSNLEYIIIPDSVTSIDSSAFAGCISLVSVTLPYRIKSIESYLFSGCISLEDIIIPRSVTNICESAFANCGNLNSISIPDGVVSVGDWSFIGCKNLRTIFIPASVSNIGVDVFGGCVQLASIEVDRENSNYSSANGLLLSKDGSCLYECCSGAVVIPNGVMNISMLMAGGVTSLRIPASVCMIEEDAFAFCNKLMHFDVDDDNPFFSSANGLLLSKDGSKIIHGIGGDVEIPYGVENIDMDAFQGCKELTSVKIPATVASIEKSTFFFNDKLVSFEVAEDNPNYSSANGVLLSKDGKTLILGVNGDVIIPDGVQAIEDSAFYYCENLRSVIIPDGVTDIGWMAFFACVNLERISIPASVTNIGGDVFISCNKIADVTVPGWMCNLPVNNITNLTISAGTTEIKYGAFSGLTAITTLTIPDGVVVIEGGAFSDCSALTSVTIPASVRNIESSAFNKCCGLKYVVMRGDCPVMGGGVFGWVDSSCLALLPTGNTTYKRVDGKWQGITAIYYEGEGLEAETNIQASFENINGVEWTFLMLGDGVQIGSVPSSVSGVVTIPTMHKGSPVTSITGYAFAGCADIISVIIPNGVTSIGAYAFSGCSSLASISIPDSVAYIGDRAFDGCDIKVWYKGAYWPSEAFNPDKSLIVHTEIRESDPTILDVVYLAKSKNQTIKVRALAFEDGERSFAKVVRPETFVNDAEGNPTAQNIGDEIEANVPHTLSWKVSADWETRLAKMKFEALVCEGELLPLELRTIPASDFCGRIEFSRNVITATQLMDALFWLYADNDSGLSLADGTLIIDGTSVVKDGDFAFWNEYGYNDWSQVAIRYVYDKMGYKLLSSWDDQYEFNVLEYVNNETRLDLRPRGWSIIQYAYKIINE